MAFRIDKAIVKGWIDNITPGMTRGAVEIKGIQRPIKILLRGNCWRDLAGTRIDFTNPTPEEDPELIKHLHTFQRGVIGDMTASRKVNTPNVSPEDMKEFDLSSSDVSHSWKNALYLEWYSLVNGRVIIDTTDFDIKISAHQWELDLAGEKKQRQDNALAMEHFMELMITASDAQSVVKEIEGEVDEFEWERRLRVRDTLEEAAWFLGQAPLASSTSDSDALGSTDPVGSLDDYEIEEVSLKGRVPIVQHAIIVQSKALDLLGDSMLDQGPHSDLALASAYIYDLVDETWPTEPTQLEPGYMLAVLKRVLEACNTAVAACNTLIPEDDNFEDLRNHIFHLRDLIIDQSQLLRDS